MKNKILDLGYSLSEVEELIKVSKNIEEDYKKLLNNYPIQYLIGYVNFYGYKIEVNSDVLIPRYETEYLVEKTIKYIKDKFDKKVKIVDIGTGSGAISIALSKNIDSDITAIDISSKALKVAKKNAKNNIVNIKFKKNNLLLNIKEKFDVIISNPPYISYDEDIMESVIKYEPSIALFSKDNGLFYYKEILRQARKNLNSEFIIAFEIGYKQANDIVKISNKYFKDAIIKVEKDLSGKDRYIFIMNK